MAVYSVFRPPKRDKKVRFGDLQTATHTATLAIKKKQAVTAVNF